MRENIAISHPIEIPKHRLVTRASQSPPYPIKIPKNRLVLRVLHDWVGNIVAILRPIDIGWVLVLHYKLQDSRGIKRAENKKLLH